jgi:hypothetical protein
LGTWDFLGNKGEWEQGIFGEQALTPVETAFMPSERNDKGEGKIIRRLEIGVWNSEFRISYCELIIANFEFRIQNHLQHGNTNFIDIIIVLQPHYLDCTN